MNFFNQLYPYSKFKKKKSNIIFQGLLYFSQTSKKNENAEEILNKYYSKDRIKIKYFPIFLKSFKESFKKNGILFTITCISFIITFQSYSKNQKYKKKMEIVDSELKKMEENKNELNSIKKEILEKIQQSTLDNNSKKIIENIIEDSVKNNLENISKKENILENISQKSYYFISYISYLIKLIIESESTLY